MYKKVRARGGRARREAKSSPYRCYLQSLLCAPGKATATTTSARLPQMNWRAAGPDLVRRVAAAGPRLDRLCAAGRLGPLNVSNLFVSDARGGKRVRHSQRLLSRPFSARFG